MVRAFLKTVPVPTAGLALGVVAFGKLIGAFSTMAEDVCAVVALALVLLVTAKAIMCPRALANDLQNPVQAAVFGTFFMTYMQLSTYVAGASLLVGRVLWAAAVIGHFCLMAWFTARFVRGFAWKNVFATWFVCYVGIIVGSVTAPALHLEAVGQGLFWFGFVAYAVLLFVVTARYAKLPVPAPAAPTFCIYAAPMSLSIAGYVAVFEPSLAFLVVLELLAQALFVMVLTQLPKFLRGGFFPSFAAMTFPFVITATALFRTIGSLRDAGIAVPGALDALFAVEALLAGAITLFVLVRFLGLFARNLHEAIATEPATAQATTR